LGLLQATADQVGYQVEISVGGNAPNKERQMGGVVIVKIAGKDDAFKKAIFESSIAFEVSEKNEQKQKVIVDTAIEYVIDYENGKVVHKSFADFVGK
jgi:hypothetical protein